MTKSCSYCYISDRKPTTKDYFDKMNLWRQYFDDGIFKFIKGDTPLENFEEIISKEEKYIYYHYFQCRCDSLISAGVCIRSSEPVLEHIKELPFN